MEIEIKNSDLTAVEAGILVIPVEQGEVEQALGPIPAASGVDIAALAAEEHFTGAEGQTYLLRGLTGMAAKRLLLVGIGTTGERAMDSVRAAGASATRVARSVHATHVALAVPGDDVSTVQFIEGAILGAYTFDRYLSKKDDDFAGFESLAILNPNGVAEAVREAKMIAGGVCFARDLVNETPNNLTPDALATKALDTASKFGLECKIFDEDYLQRNGFELIMAVGNGSQNRPRLIHLTYKPEGEVTKRIAFVGKGVTFDTGGYNIKPGSSMLAMHSDMAGAAAVLGAAQAIGELKPKGVEVHFVCPAAENSISGNAMRPQDIFRGYGGQTVEIHNTDAEGRLILADALAYIQEFKVDTIIDLATLTGASVVALGELTSALFTDDEDLFADLTRAAKTAGEDFWRLPLNKKLDKGLDTPMADMKNIGPRWGGAITAALFLKRWVNIDSWAHLDIAGPAYSDKESALSPPGGTGFGVSTLVEYVLDLSKS